MLVRHGDTAHNGPHDSDEALVGTAEEKIVESSGAIQLLVGCAVNRSVVVRSETSNGFGGKNIGIDDMPTEVGHESYRRCDGFVVPA